MRLPRRHVLRLAAAAAGIAAAPRLAVAQSYPTRPVRIIVPVPPGGTFDIVGRLIAQWLSQHLGEFVVENRAGAGTKLGTDVVAHAAPDGYTLLLAGSPGAINETLYEKLDFDFKHDIAPVAGIERAPLIMAVNPALPAKTVKDFIAYAKANSGKINMASGGSGSTGHVSGELFAMMAGIAMAHVPYRGEAPAVADVVAGHVQVVFATAGSAISFVRSGTLRALAVTSAARLDVLPDVPVVADDLPGYEASAWAGLGAPAGTPADIIERINRETNAAFADAQFKAHLADFGAAPMPGSPGDFGKVIDDDIAKWGKVIKFANIKPED